MQRTRLSTLTDATIYRIESFFGNPWRRISLIAIGLLFGFFFGSAISTTSGQTASWDVVVAGLLLLFTEVISRWTYSRRQQQRGGENRPSLWRELLNAFKIGMSYSLYLEAFKLGS
jgi:hypothetical protein